MGSAIALNNRTLHYDLKHGDQLLVDGGRVVIEFVHKSGQVARLKFTANEDIAIDPVRQRPALPGVMSST